MLNNSTQSKIRLLSICIPTYNRSDLLAKGLDAILSQMDEYSASEVEIIISDNASPDKTADVVKAKRDAFPQAQITYICQSTNIGAVNNVWDVIKRGTGKYLLVLSDDDILLPGALDGILMRLKQHPDLDALALNVSWFQYSSEEKLKPVYKLYADCIIYDRGSALEFLGTNITYISCLAIRRELISGKIFSYSIESIFPHSYTFIDVLAHEAGMLVIKEPALSARGNIEVGYNVFEAFVTDFNKIMEYAKSIGYPKEATRAVLNKHSKWLAGYTEGLVISKSVRCKPFSRLNATKRLHAVYGFNPYVFMKIILMLLLPRPVAIVVNKIYRSLHFCLRAVGCQRGSP